MKYKRFVALLLSLLMCTTLFACGGTDSTENTDLNGTKVVYVPLDNRPVNFDRAFYLAESVGIDLIMPEEEWLSTTLGEVYDQGNCADIFGWLKQQEAEYYIISLDMLFSGGLVGSRAAFDDTDDSVANMNSSFGSYTLSQTEQEMVDYLVTLSETKHVVLFDTVMRLASTVNYGGWDMNLYNYLRGQYASVERKQLYDDELTVENIVAGYEFDKDGKKISTTFGKDFSAEVNEYLRSRERKMVIADKLYSLCADNVAGIFIGVDDSSPNVNIQSNEIRYVKDNLMKGKENRLLFSGADELGLMGISEVATAMYGEIKVNLQYFGEGETYVADGFDPGTLGESVVSHIDAVGGIIDKENADMDVLVLTRSASTGANATVHKNNVDKLIAKLEENLANNIPTCVIDGSSYDGYGVLAQAMIDKKIGLSEILGFSAWNTVGNAIGISLSNATARMTYLKNSENITEDSHKGFMKTVAFSHVKDTAYKKFGNLPHTSQGNYKANYKKFVDYSVQLAELINGSEMLTSVNSRENKYDISLSDLCWPWDRNFEASFTVDVVENGQSSVFPE